MSLLGESRLQSLSTSAESSQEAALAIHRWFTMGYCPSFETPDVLERNLCRRYRRWSRREARRIRGRPNEALRRRLEITSVKSTPLIVRNAASDANICSDEKAFSLQVVALRSVPHPSRGHRDGRRDGGHDRCGRQQSYELKFSERVQGLTLSPPWSRFRRVRRDARGTRRASDQCAQRSGRCVVHLHPFVLGPTGGM